MSILQSRGISAVVVLYLIANLMVVLATAAHPEQKNCNMMKKFSEISHQIESKLPFHDFNMEICYNGKEQKHQRSCCTHDDELKYMKRSRDDIQAEITSKNDHIKNLLETGLNTFKGKFKDLLDQTDHNTAYVLKRVHSLSPSIANQISSRFFTALKNHLAGKRDNFLHVNVNSFFDELFSHIFYKKDISDPTTLSLARDYHDCITSIRRQIFPEPFGVVPRSIISDLTNIFVLSQTFLDSIQIAISALNTLNNLIVDRSCLAAQIRMHLCPFCYGYKDVKPCRGLCLNIYRGCLSHIMKFTYSWDVLLSSIKALSLNLRKRGGFQDILDSFDSQISVALIEAIKKQSKYYPEIIKKVNCGEPRIKNSTSSSSQPLASHAEDIPRHSIDVNTDVKRFMADIAPYQGWQTRISDLICNNTVKYEQSLTSDSCWNGKHVSLYNDQIPDSSYISQLKYNPEVSLPQHSSQVFTKLSEEIRNIKQKVNLILNRKNEFFQSDEGGNSGDGDTGDTYRTNSFKVASETNNDDEDDVSGSGSGSGDEENKNGDKDMKNDVTDEFVIENLEPTPDAGRVEGSQESSASLLSTVSIKLTIPLLISALTITHMSTCSR